MADTSSDVAGFISDKTVTAIQQTWVNGKWVNLTDTNQRNNMQVALTKVGEQVEEQQAGITDAQNVANAAVNSASQAIEASKVNSQAIIAVNSATSEAKSDAANAFTQAESAMSAATSNSSALKSQSVVIDSTASQVALKANQAVVNTLKDTVSANSAAISVQADAIKQKVTSSDVQGLLNSGGYATQTWTSGQLELAANKFSLNLSALQTQVNNSAVGTNYIANSGPELTVNGDVEHYKVLYDQLTPRTWTFSSNAKYTKGTDTSIFLSCYDNDLQKNWPGYSAPIKDGKIAWTFTVKNVAEVKLLIYASSGAWSTTPGKEIVIDHYKLEKGDVATDWCPNPADNASITSVTNLEATVDGLQTTVSNKVNAVDYNSKMTQLSNLIDGKVSTADYNAEVAVLANDIALKVSKGDVVSQINQEAGGNTLIQVASGKGKLYLDAATTVFGGTAFISDAMITSLNADKLVAGTVKGSLIQAGSITADKMAADFFQVGLDNYGDNIKITPDTIQVYTPGVQEPTMVLTQDGLGFRDNNNAEQLGEIYGGRMYNNDPEYNGIQIGLFPDDDIFAISKVAADSTTTPLFVWSQSNKSDEHRIELGFNFNDFVTFNKPLIVQDKIWNHWGDVNFHVTNYNSAGVGVCFGNDGHLYFLNKNKYVDSVKALNITGV